MTIVKLAGKARGGGAEFVAAADMAFAAAETAGIGQIEALMGIIPGGGQTQYLRDRVGRNRALEVVLTADLFDAETAASYGWINRALPADQLRGVGRSDCFARCSATDGPRTAQRGTDTHR
ncbi:enoyl-CoA hydratase/isomerase family protein [Streptomyces sparsogenes]|uniref:enoyl-CoA hydratase/isomerase family protein n=1 Tax=Streptomyces sparsogenes TaxID=67365 RepID=UPI003F4D130D